MFGLRSDERVQLKGTKGTKENEGTKEESLVGLLGAFGALVFLRYHRRMADNFLDHLPSLEREKIRKRLRSPEEYERLREKVKGPEDLERELKRSEMLADVHFAIESDPAKKEALKSRVESSIAESGVEAVLEKGTKLSPEMKKVIEAGKFTVAISSHPKTHDDHVVVMPEGKVAEKFPVRSSLAERFVAGLSTKA